MPQASPVFTSIPGFQLCDVLLQHAKEAAGIPSAFIAALASGFAQAAASLHFVHGRCSSVRWSRTIL